MGNYGKFIIDNEGISKIRREKTFGCVLDAAYQPLSLDYDELSISIQVA